MEINHGLLSSANQLRRSCQVTRQEGITYHLRPNNRQGRIRHGESLIKDTNREVIDNNFKARPGAGFGRFAGALHWLPVMDGSRPSAATNIRRQG